VVGLQLRRWNVGSGRALIDSQDQRKGWSHAISPFPPPGCRKMVAGAPRLLPNSNIHRTFNPQSSNLLHAPLFSHTPH
jgi:hypothetical protein